MPDEDQPYPPPPEGATVETAAMRSRRRRARRADGLPGTTPRRSVETVLLTLGATVLLGVTVALAAGRLSDDTGRVADGHRKTTTTTAPAARPETTTPPPTTTQSARAPRPAITAGDERRALAALATRGTPIYCGGVKKGMVALTFEGGPGPSTHEVLNRLERNRLRASFFLVGGNLAEYGSLVPQLLEHGTVGNLTRNRADLSTLGRAKQEDTIVSAQKAIAQAAGRPVQLFRPPNGTRDQQIDGIAQAAGMVSVLWSVDSGDRAGAGVDAIKQKVIDGLRPGAIIRMHDNVAATVRALPAILHAVRAKRLRAVSLDLMLTADPPSRARLRAGRAGCGPA